MTEPARLPVWADPGVPDADLDPQGLSRRSLLRRAGGYGAGFAATAAFGAAASPSPAGAATPTEDVPNLVYLVGDHHVHSQFSHDAKYRPTDLARRAAQYGLDWMVFTEHSNFGHADAGGADTEHALIQAAREENPRLLIFQGLEWYIPAAEHATVFTAPGAYEATVLREFEKAYDGKLLKRTEGGAGNPATPDNEAHAVAGIQWLATQKRKGRVPDVLVLANHPSRLGVDSPHELRNWRDAAPGIVIGMEGAPGAQGAAMPGVGSATSVRGEYQNKPSGQSWPGYPAEWPGQFSRTHVGVTRYGYLEVMAGLRAGRVWVDHGQLIDAIDVRLEAPHSRATLGGRVKARRGERLTLVVTITAASRPNLHGLLPRLAHLDVIRGVTGKAAADRDNFVAPLTRVEQTIVTGRKTGTYTLRLPLGAAKESGYVRLRGSDGKRNGPGLRGRVVDPHGPQPHPANEGDPWLDTWLYTNPIFIDVR